MATYSALKSKVLTLVEQTGSTDVGAVAEIGLEEAMKYVATRVALPSLRGSGSYTWVDGDTSASIVSDFGIADFTFAERLFVNEVAYAFRDYSTWLDLKFQPGSTRTSTINPAYLRDERPQRAYTIDDSNNVIPYPITAGDVLLLRYVKAPAAYADATTPEIPTLFDFILVNGAVMYCKDYLKGLDLQTPQVINPYQLLQTLNPQIDELDIYLHTLRKDNVHKIHPSYR